jgi:CDP-6-deoxy-D-xylo-4-hexulose-3-dehydrase
MNIEENIIECHITEKTKAILLVHVMGNCCNMDLIEKIALKYNLLVVEDTCESLGSSFKNKKLGSFGTFGTYSFYYSHHITTIEGGMVVTNNKKNYDLLRCLRAHGWTRYFDKNEQEMYKNRYPDIDTRYMFVNVGYNFRPMELQAVMGLVQLEKLNLKNENRIYNYTELKKNILKHEKNNDSKIILFQEQNDSYIAWFGFCFYLNKKYTEDYNNFILYLEKNSIENRPIITGNFTRQPYFKIHNYDFDCNEFVNADVLHNNGIYIGLSCEKYENEDIEHICNILFNYFVII